MTGAKYKRKCLSCSSGQKCQTQDGDVKLACTRALCWKSTFIIRASWFLLRIRIKQFILYGPTVRYVLVFSMSASKSLTTSYLDLSMLMSLCLYISLQKEFVFAFLAKYACIRMLQLKTFWKT